MDNDSESMIEQMSTELDLIESFTNQVNSITELYDKSRSVLASDLPRLASLLQSVLNIICLSPAFDMIDTGSYIEPLRTSTEANFSNIELDGASRQPFPMHLIYKLNHWGSVMHYDDYRRFGDHFFYGGFVNAVQLGLVQISTFDDPEQRPIQGNDDTSEIAYYSIAEGEELFNGLTALISEATPFAVEFRFDIRADHAESLLLDPDILTEYEDEWEEDPRDDESWNFREELDQELTADPVYWTDDDLEVGNDGVWDPEENWDNRERLLLRFVEPKYGEADADESFESGNDADGNPLA